MDEDPLYLQPGFDPNSFKVLELRRILFENDIDVPTGALKPQLVDLFNKNIAPRAQSILAQRNQVRASSRGIVSVDRDGNALGESSRRVTRRGGRRGVVDTDRDALEEVDIPDPVPKRTPARTTSPAKRASGRYSKVGTEDLGEPEAPRTTRKTKRSSSRPVTTIEPETPMVSRIQKREEDDDPDKSPFSDENVFQRGSPTFRKTPPNSKESSRKSLQPRNAPGTDDRRVRRQTDFLPSRPFSGFASSSTDYQVSPPLLDSPIIKQEKFDDEDPIPAGEEFTPEGALEVAQADWELGQIAHRRSSRRRGTTAPTASMLWVVIGTLLSAYFVWWRREKVEIGYCGVGNTAPQGLIRNDYEWSTFLRPECEPCPPNAICKPNYTAECKPDYVLVNNPFSLFGLIPLPPTCEPDSEKLRRIAILSDEAIKVLRKRAADVECGGLPPIKPSVGAKEGEAVEVPRSVVGAEEGGPIERGKGMDESELRKVLYELKAPKLSDAQFNELWKAALEDIASRDEIEAKDDSISHRLVLASTSLASIPLTCSIRLSTLRTLAHYRLELLSALAAFCAIWRINTKVQQRQMSNALVTKYVHLVLRLLARKAEQAYAGGREEDAAVAVVQMRDQVLQHEFDPERRKRIWQGVQSIVECNSNVRAANREVRGEVLRCWTWIGAVGVLEDNPQGLGSGVVWGGTGCQGEKGELRIKEEDWVRQIEFPRVVA